MGACMAALLLTGSCKKKDETATVPVTGTWTNASSTATAYYIFKDDGTFLKLSASAIGVHSKTSDVYAADENTIIFSPESSGNQLYNYKVSNDSLYISNANSYYVFIKATGIDADTWVKKSTLLQAIPLASGRWFGALDWNGLDFVVSNRDVNKVYKIDGTTFNVYDSITVTQESPGLAMIGTDTWLNNLGNDTKLHQVNSVTGTTLFSSSAAAQAPVIMASQGSDIWFFNTAGDLYTYNTVTDNFTLKHSGVEFTSGSSFYPDMVIKDGYAYICLATSVIKFNLSTYQVDETYELDTSQGFALGIAHNGTNFYTISISLTAFYGGNIVLNLNKIAF